MSIASFNIVYRQCGQSERRQSTTLDSRLVLRYLVRMLDISLRDLQKLIRTMYYDKDAARGAEATFLWFTEEVGELASAVRNGSSEELHAEFADVLAWLVTLANIKNVDLTQALAQKYGSGCPGCGKLTCQCPDSEKP